MIAGKEDYQSETLFTNAKEIDYLFQTILASTDKWSWAVLHHESRLCESDSTLEIHVQWCHQQINRHRHARQETLKVLLQAWKNQGMLLNKLILYMSWKNMLVKLNVQFLCDLHLYHKKMYQQWNRRVQQIRWVDKDRDGKLNKLEVEAFRRNIRQFGIEAPKWKLTETSS